ncbi:MAG: hypothetical protein ABSC71_04205 [Candidatus Acidiferrales bacterium]|jgi:hypothetical protein
MLRRAQAVVLVLALLAAPFALYARGIAGDMQNCNGLCCLPQHHHLPASTSALAPAAAPAAAAQSTVGTEPECHHHSASAAKAKTHANPDAATVDASDEAGRACAIHCAMHSRPHTMNFGLLAPIAPTKPSDLAAIRIAIDIITTVTASNVSAPSGFLASPFQPPRA